MNRWNRHVVAVFLLLIFAQGTGMRLWMHHWFHQTSGVAQTHFSDVHKLTANCDCLQDAMMPMQGATAFTLPAPPSILLADHLIDDIYLASLDAIFCSLKGPPPVC